MATNNYNQIDDSDDSDIQEVAVILPSSSPDHQQPMPIHSFKRRKSSPQMDPIPTYTPTPIHVLEQRSKHTSSGSQLSYYDRVEYTPMPIPTTDTSPVGWGYDKSSSSGGDATSKRDNHEDYIPLLGPTPCVVGQTVVRSPPQGVKTRQSISRANSASAVRPAPRELIQAVTKRRNSQQKESSDVSPRNAEQPVPWSPQLPSQIEPIKTLQPDSIGEEELEKFKSPRMTKQRVAHKPNLSHNKSNRPRIPTGVSKKVPLALRTKYLEVIINEYLNTGHPEEEAYNQAQQDEQAIAARAANKSIYINLIAGAKKKIREKAGVSTLPLDDDPKYVNGNKVVSHSEILTGKVTGTFSIERKRKSSDPSALSESELYDRLLRYVVPIEQLEDYNYPTPDPEELGRRKIPTKDGQKQQLREGFASSYTCERCAKLYRVDQETGLPLSTTGKCIYHPGHLWNERINRALEKRYSCCKGDPLAGGCSSNPYHVHRGDSQLENYKGYVETQDKPERDPNNHGIRALDCEMCYTTYGLELTRVTVIDHKSEVVYEKLVKPENHILDYNTKFSGIKAGDLDDVTTNLADVQRDLLEMFSSKTILIGHSLDSDMKALKIFHKRFIDTAQLFPHKRGLPFKRALRTLMVENLRVIIQEDAGHDSKEDASAALRLVLWKVKTDVPEKAK